MPGRDRPKGYGIAYLPPALKRGRAWGFALNLYALRSSHNWGIGDFGDLRSFVRYAAAAGADLIGVNPLHALHITEPEAASPYAPTSRYFLNPLYIEVDAVAELTAEVPAATALRARIGSSPLAETLAELRAAPHVDYAGVAHAKWSVLDACYQIFRVTGGSRCAAFRDFTEERGERLERFAVYQALSERFARRRPAVSGWLRWPAEYHDLRSDAVRSFASAARRRIEYFKYLQWVAHEQLADVAREAGKLAIGLYLDVAVGVDFDSADVWSDRGAYVLDEAVGAPPDALGPLGQNWGLPPPEPQAMLRQGGADFAALLASNMEFAGALRLDHAMALLRLFRFPRGKTPAEGRYVAYPLEALLAVAAKESGRGRCLIVGEDLGNVPDGFRERMERARIFSYRLLLFERESDGRFKTPSAYPSLALATTTTHDLPTLCGWALGCDLDTRERLGITKSAAIRDARVLRRVEGSQLLDALRTQDELGDGEFERLHRSLDRDAREGSPYEPDRHAGEHASYEPLVRAAYRYLARSRARLVLVQLDDALGEFEQMNVPGTYREYPNWRRKNRLDVAAIAADEAVAAIARDVRERVHG